MRVNQQALVVCLVWTLIAGQSGNLQAQEQQPEPLQPQPEAALPEQLAGRQLSLLECVKFAIDHSYEVKLARLDFLISRTDITAAQAVYDLVISADASYEKDQRQSTSIFASDLSRTNIYALGATKTLPSGTELTLSLTDARDWDDNTAYTSMNPSHTAEASIEVRQPVGKNRFGYIDRRDITVTELAVANADLDTKERIEVLLADVEQAYWQWAFYKENLEVFSQILEKAQKLHQANAANFDLGRIEKAALLASEANLLIKEKNLSLAENKYRQAEEKIKLLINMEAGQRVDPAEQLQYKKFDVNLEQCLNAAFVKRRDYQQAKRDIEKEQLTLETKANSLWPEIDLVASLAANGVHSEFGRAVNNIVSDQDNTKYYTGIEISVLADNSVAKSEHDKATRTKEKALVTLKSVERTIVTEVGDAFRDYQTYQLNLAKLEEVVRLQSEKLKEEERRFQFGRSNTETLIEFQNDYLRAQLDLATSVVDLEVARISLEKAINSILEKYARLL
ncbi:TolC family protein [Candidatus Omnitrophota bacterium]